MTEIINLIPPMIMGMMAGIVTGMLPGPSAVTAIVVSYAWLAKLDALSLLVFYFALVNTMQYFASISAPVYGVMGDITSQPAVTHGHRLFLRGHGLDALVGSSTASFAAAMLSIACFVVCVGTGHYHLVVEGLDFLYNGLGQPGRIDNGHWSLGRCHGCLCARVSAGQSWLRSYFAAKDLYHGHRPTGCRYTGFATGHGPDHGAGDNRPTA